eukprot:5597875-Pleurochrysis_carterae.AAC.7
MNTYCLRGTNGSKTCMAGHGISEESRTHRGRSPAGSRDNTIDVETLFSRRCCLMSQDPSYQKHRLQRRGSESACNRALS